MRVVNGGYMCMYACGVLGVWGWGDWAESL